MLKKNIAKTMAAATVFTAVIPAAQSFAAVVNTTQEQEIKELKADVLAKFNTKYTENEVLKGANAGQEAYTIKMQVLNKATNTYMDYVIDNSTGRVNFDSYAEFEAAFDKEFAKLHNGEKILVDCAAGPIRVLEDGTVVDFADVIDKTNGVRRYGATDTVVNSLPFINKLATTGKTANFGQLADGTNYLNVPTTNGYIQLKDTDAILDLNAPIFKVEDGNYVTNEGVAIKKFDEKTVRQDAETVYEKGGVIEGYYLYSGINTGEHKPAKVDNVTYAIVKDADSVNREDVLTSDLYEASTDRLTKKGNELRKAIIEADKLTGSTEDKLRVEISGITKAGTKLPRAVLLNPTANGLNFNELDEIKVVFEERANHISEWNPVYEIAITEVRNNEFKNVVNHVIADLDMAKGMNLAAGLDRYETSVELSKEGWNTLNNNGVYADTVVLVSGANDKLVDGLTATPLAAKTNAPVLLTNKDSIPTEVIDEIKRLGAKNVYIVGGESAVSTEIEELLTTKYSKNVTRLAGDSRYETSMVVAEELLRLEKLSNTAYKFNEVFVVGGKGEADALSASAIAGHKKSPILLTQADELDKDVEGFLKANLADSRIVNGNDATDIFVVGGNNSVSKEVQSQLATIAGTDFEIKRLAGEGRQETNAAVIDEFANAFTKVVVGKSNNEALVDSLSAGAYAATSGAHIVLATDKLAESQEDALAKVRGNALNSPITKTVQAGYGVSQKVASFIKGLR